MKTAGLYIHIPYCKRKCTYCNFHFSTQFSSKEKLLSALHSEMHARSKELENVKVETIYFGGGTPSVLKIHEIELLLNTLYRNYSICTNPEITLEANPDDLNLSFLQNLKRIGINRLSIGIQSFDDSELKWMNRAHNSKQSHQAIAYAIEAGFENINCDLIFGIPESSDQNWILNIDQLIQYQIPHLSCYALTVEEKTKLHADIKKQITLGPSDEHTVGQMKLLFQQMAQSGYEAYEISNYCKPGLRSKHNSNYWLGKSYLGFGPSAHSFHQNQRRWNVSNNNLYIHGVESNLSYFEKEELSRRDLYNEYIMIHLRRIEGIDTDYIREFFPEFHTDLLTNLMKLINREYFLKIGTTYSLTNEGKIMSDWIIRELFHLA